MTAEATASFLRVEVAQILKSVLFIADGQPLLVGVCVSSMRP